MECSLGQTAEDMKESTSMTRKKVKESFSGQMAESTREAGKTENNTELVSTPPQVVKPSKESGKKVKDYIGSKPINDQYPIIYFILNSIILMI